MRIILARHGERVAGTKDIDARLPLSELGKSQATRLGIQIIQRAKPAVFFSSRNIHAKETARILAGEGAAPVVELDALTPAFQAPMGFTGIWQGLAMIEEIARQASESGHALAKLDCVAMILHKPRLEQVAGSVTGRDQGDFRDLGYGEGVCLVGDSLTAFLTGKASVEKPRFRQADP